MAQDSLGLADAELFDTAVLLDTSVEALDAPVVCPQVAKVLAGVSLYPSGIAGVKSVVARLELVFTLLENFNSAH